ncbi:hypothetical protein RD792_012481 [Penstemon davidsonii]|uniref:CSC1-like protein n=1 Tax=Penstemon davidsonii TaxID=160366 RepID=A0ABR0CX03_9LAMI|nr:hypothetical protein RD792_012481 [Penstemon davidsonii]
MIVSALLTSVGINSGLCVLFFNLYSILKKQPVYYNVYAPRLLVDGELRMSNSFNIERLIPNPGWMRQTWELSEDEFLSSSGLDAMVFMHIITFSLRVFTLSGIIGVFVLLPVNFSGDQLHDINFANLTNNSLDLFTISNLKNGSKRLWVHFWAIYIITIFVCYLLYYEYAYVSSKRIAFLRSSIPLPQHFTILVHSIPLQPRTNINNIVENFFTEYHPSTYLSHLAVGRANKLINRNEVRAAFVSFKSRYAASMALHMQQSDNPIEWVTEQAPAPHDVYWPFFYSSFMQRWISKLVVVFVCLLLTFLFLIPVLIVQGLTNLSQLEARFPFLKSILKIAFISQVLTGYLPSLILQLFLKAVPRIMKFLSSIQGYISRSEIKRSACNKVLWFTVWNIFLANVFSGSILNQLAVFLEPKNVPARLAVAVPGQASFFIAYVVTSGWTSTLTELFRLIPLIISLIKKPFVKPSSTDEFKAPTFSYHVHIPRVLFFGLLGITYFFLAPLILPFLSIYFCLGYIIYRNQLINVYAPKYETGGRYWPIVHNSVIFSLLMMHAIAVGIFTLKKLPLASSLLVPLPVFTLVFNSYCRKRFLPIFTGYSAESLINKDRGDINEDPRMAEFFNTLVTAYQNPALLPKHNNHETQSSPLLSTVQV